MIENQTLRIELVGAEERLWQVILRENGTVVDVEPPCFQVDGNAVTGPLEGLEPCGQPQKLQNGTCEHVWQGRFARAPGLHLQIRLRVAPDSPVVRFAYELKSDSPCSLTKAGGSDELTYLAFSAAELTEATEVRLSAFNEMVHSYCLEEAEIGPASFRNRLSLVGPIFVGSAPNHALLFAYEHGSEAVEPFLQFHLRPDRRVELRAVKGNYFHGQPLDRDNPYRTIWLQVAAVAGSREVLARAYRDFVLCYLSLRPATRTPYIFYNTWNYQERNEWWNDRTFLASMNEERILREIDVAHRMGVEVFVLDTGWYEKTGDWRVSKARFPRGLQPIKEELDRYGMRLGLWFSPTHAAVSSRIGRKHSDCLMMWNGQAGKPQSIWQTQESQPFCLVSQYADAFADELIRLIKDVGVSYFKWDAVGQYGCDSPDHRHGSAENGVQERRDCYAFQMCCAVIRVAERICEACPEAIVDFDMTEPGRCLGLGFLSVGKYFLMNNGPYFPNYDFPYDLTCWSNIFVHPGPARGWICRTPLGYDGWIPSVLFLTHYLPDDPAESQLLNIASLILGQNGIWGDLLNLSEEGIRRFGGLLGLYKQVRDDITASYPVRSGAVGSSPEVHEKISARTGRGAVVIFSSARRACSHRYITRNKPVTDCWHTEGLMVKIGPDGRAAIEARFDGPGAQMVFFGAGEK